MEECKGVGVELIVTTRPISENPDDQLLLQMLRSDC